MKYDIVIADPAKNITLFVLNPVQDRAAAVKALMTDPSLGAAEQLGFVISPEKKGDPWRLEMMGGEFCGNAARSFGLYVARRMGLTGKTAVTIEISGSSAPLTVQVDTKEGLAEAALPAPVAEETLLFNGVGLPVYHFEGITHIIAPDIKPGKDVFYTIKDLFEKRGSPRKGSRRSPGAGRLPDAGHPSDALGVLFWDSGAKIMSPAVYVRGSGTLVFESSCGSGSAALGVWLSRDIRDGENRISLRQPGGVIEVALTKRGGELTSLSIGGPVKLYYPD
jgi:diaminopimelate epimerase